MMAINRYRCIAFDAVGTLITPVPPPGEVYFQAACRAGSRLTAGEIATRFKLAFRNSELADAKAGEELRLLTSETRERERWTQIVAEVIDDIADTTACFEELFAHFARPQAWRCFDEVPELLARLQSDGYSVAIASNFDRRLHDVCSGFPTLEAIQTRVISSEVGHRKPGRKFFDALVAQAGCDPANVLMVGDDRANDFEGARSAGLGAVLINRRRQPRAGRSAPDEIGSLSELVGLLQKEH